jgi:hypothetical protein
LNQAFNTLVASLQSAPRLKLYEEEKDERIRFILLDQSALIIGVDLRSANSNKKSILVQTQLSLLYILSPQIFIDTVSLVDSSCTAVVFTDKASIINRYNITIRKLLALRLLYLADDVPVLFITDYFTVWMSISAHTETIFFFMIKLSPANLIIFSML